MSPRKKKLPPIQVLIPYETLEELLAAAKMVGSLVEDNKNLRAQVAALRNQFVERMEEFRMIQD